MPSLPIRVTCRLAAALVVALSALLLTVMAHAQASPDGAYSVEPAPQSPQTCVPACRVGYVCNLEGICVSACNPPCPQGSVCTAERSCIAVGEPPRARRARPQTAADWRTHLEERDRRKHERQKKSAYLHDRLFIRGGFGVGYAMADVGVAGGGSFSMDGVAAVAQVVGGWAVVPGMIVGGGALLSVVPEPQTTPARPASDATFSTVGATLVWYPDPTGGFHLNFLGGFAFGGVDLVDSPDAGGQEDSFGMALGSGYEFWLSRMFSLGVQGQVLFLPSLTTGSLEHEVWVPMLGVAGTLN